MILQNYNTVRDLIQEGDVLLFRGTSIVAKLIQRAGEGMYSHIGLASWHTKNLECVEFREYKGGRAVSLRRQVEKFNNLIDVYRPAQQVVIPRYDNITNTIQYDTITFEGNKVTDCMREQTGLPYGWKRIFWIAKHKLAVFRLFYNMDNLVNDKNSGSVVYPVCSTIIAHCFSQAGYDLVHNRSDTWNEPNDIARSAVLTYLFTLVYEK